MSQARNPVLISIFGEVLKRARLKAGLTQEQLALEAGVDRTFIGLLESGKRQPTISVLFVLADALQVSPETLIKLTRAKMAHAM